MARTNTIEMAKQIAGKFADRIDDKRRIESTLLWAKTSFVIPPSGFASGDVIGVVRLPDGAIVRPEHGFILCNDPGTALAGTMGDGTDADRYSGTMTLDAGGRVPFIAANAVAFPAGFTTEHKVQPAQTVPDVGVSTKDILFTVTALTAATPGATIWFFVPYASL